MENTQNVGGSGNFYFDKISNYLKTTNNKQSVFLRENDGKISLKDFELYGSMAYILGLDFTSQRDTLVWSTLAKVTKRLQENNVTQADYITFVRKMRELDLSLLEEPKEKMKNRISDGIGNSAENTVLIMAIKNIMKVSSLPVQFAVETEKMMKASSGTAFTYHNLLQFNSLFYEQIDLDANCIDMIKQLLTSENYSNLLKEASERFDNQKYAIIYLDSIHTLYEFLSLHDNAEELLFNEGFIAMLQEQEEQLTDSETTDSENSTDSVDSLPTQEEYEVPHYELEQTDLFLRSSLEENLQKKIESSSDLMEALKLVFENQDYMQHVYKFLKMRANINRQPFANTYPEVNFEEFILAVDGVYNKKAIEYKTIVEKYAAEIPAEIQHKIVQLTNDTIRALVLDNKDSKGYLIQQVIENQITTYKQLHQTIGLIENCKIKISKLGAYVDLREFIENNTVVSALFQESAGIEDMVNELKFYKEVSDFMKFDLKVAEQELKAEQERNQ